mmetsp:Transcript_6245/g.20517  ORF Transcript_6245/g.20517 Transcript_6245/m.20517 type:complete len:209 (+) Transcript_6245:1697-2323(+)
MDCDPHWLSWDVGAERAERSSEPKEEGAGPGSRLMPNIGSSGGTKQAGGAGRSMCCGWSRPAAAHRSSLTRRARSISSELIKRSQPRSKSASSSTRLRWADTSDGTPPAGAVMRCLKLKQSGAWLGGVRGPEAAMRRLGARAGEVAAAQTRGAACTMPRPGWRAAAIGGATCATAWWAPVSAPRGCRWHGGAASAPPVGDGEVLAGEL